MKRADRLVVMGTGLLVFAAGRAWTARASDPPPSTGPGATASPAPVGPSEAELRAMMPGPERATYSERVLIVLSPGFEDIEFLYLWYRWQEAGYRVTLVSEQAGPVTGLRGYAVDVPYTCEEVDADWFAALVIPGGPGALSVADNLQVREIVRQFDREKKVIVAMGQGVRVLAAAEILKGRRVATVDGAVPEVERAGGVPAGRPVFRDQRMITGSTPGALPAVAREMLRQLEVLRKKA